MCFSVGANASELSYNEMKYTKAEVCPQKMNPRATEHTVHLLSIPGRKRLGQPCSHSWLLKESKPHAQLQLLSAALAGEKM